MHDGRRIFRKSDVPHFGVVTHEVNLDAVFDVVGQIVEVALVFVRKYQAVNTGTFSLNYKKILVTKLHHEPLNIRTMNLLTARVFSLMPPTGKTFPVKETSPVIAMSFTTERF